MGSLAEHEGRGPLLNREQMIPLGASTEEGDLGPPGSEAAKGSRWMLEGLERSNEDDPYHEAATSSPPA